MEPKLTTNFQNEVLNFAKFRSFTFRPIISKNKGALGLKICLKHIQNYVASSFLAEVITK